MEKNSEKLKPAMTTPNKWKRTFNLIRQNSTTCYGNVPEEDSTCHHDMFIPKLKEETSPKFVKWETTVDKAHVQEISKMVHDANLELLKEKLKEEPAKFKTKRKRVNTLSLNFLFCLQTYYDSFELKLIINIYSQGLSLYLFFRLKNL